MKWYQYALGFVVPQYFFIVAISLWQVFDLDLITLAVVMLIMAPFANWATDQLLYPETRNWFTGDERYGYGFLLAVSVLAFLVFKLTSLFTHSDAEAMRHALPRFVLIWFFAFPVCCAALLVLDRGFNVFGGRPIKRPPMRAPKQWPYETKGEDQQPIAIDPKRFR